MASYKYRALQSDGLMAEGLLEAGGRQEALRQLQGRGLEPVSLKEAASAQNSKSEKARGRLSFGHNHVSARDRENFTRQLSGLLGAGVPLSRALRIIQRESSSAAAREKWKALNEMVADGTALADAMAHFPKVFPRVYVAMVQAGEAGGFLDMVLGQIADFQTREKDMKSRVLSALIYPAILVTMTIGVIAFLMVYFIPVFKGMFDDFGGSLPFLTRVIVGLSESFTKYGPFTLLIVATAVIVFMRWLRSESGRRKWEQIILATPVIGNLNARFAMTRFCRMLGTLVGAGVPLIQALRVARESLGNQVLVDAVSSSIDRVRQGSRLSDSLSGCPKLFPGSVLEMISVSEETGRLSPELVRLAELADNDLDRQLRSAVALAEPLILFMMAALIGTIVVGMLLPIFTIQEFIQ
ncbi:MAG: type II secretion system F family protein [Candidatus Sumerlaeia bacterium]